MELYQAHLLLRACTARNVNMQQIWELYINRYAQASVTAAAPFRFQLCSNCGKVQEAYTPLPITDGCIQCWHSIHAGWNSYWAMHSSIMFYISKFTLEDCTVLELALSQLYDQQQRQLLLSLGEIIL